MIFQDYKGSWDSDLMQMGSDGKEVMDWDIRQLELGGKGSGN